MIKRIVLMFGISTSILLILATSTSSRIQLTDIDCQHSCSMCQQKCVPDDNARYNNCLTNCVDVEASCCQSVGGNTYSGTGCNCVVMH